MRPPRTAKEGDRFGMLKIIDLLDDGSVRCKCDCGLRFRVQRADDAARMGSCGCVRRAVPKDEGLGPRQRQPNPNYQRSARNGRLNFRYPLQVVDMIRNAPKKITGRQLARATGMTEANVSMIRNGKSRRERA